MRKYDLNIAGYAIRFESSDNAPDIMPGKRFLKSINLRNAASTADCPVITIHPGSFELPEGSVQVFHAPFVEETGGIRTGRMSEFWSVWKNNDDLFIQTVFPLSSPMKKAILKFSTGSLHWDMWFGNNEKIIDPLEYPLDGLLLYYFTVINKDIMIHASGINYKGKGYLFSGVSGKGKTTMSGLWSRQGGKVIHDDRLVLRNTNNGIIMHNTPVYDNDEPLSSPLNSIFLIEHGTDNRIEVVKGAGAVSLVMANCIQHNWSSELVSGLLDSVTGLCAELPVYKLSFKPDISVIDYILENE